MSRSAATTLLHRLQQGLPTPTVELVSVPHDLWPLPRGVKTIREPLRILVLDSSFNPPTLAHLALANSRRPSYSHDLAPVAESYDAKLLLLSVRNVDKSLKPGDASYIQRLEMMSLLARDIGSESPETADKPNAAVAMIDEPTFVGKSTTLLTFFKHRLATLLTPSLPQHDYDTQLTFLLGFDTLERLVSPRYYASESEMMVSLRKFLSPSPEGDNSRIVCARRISSPSQPDGSALNNAESRTLAVVQEFISSERIVLIDIGEEESTYSSSAVRDTIFRRDMEEGSWKKFVPCSIAEYITREGLYTSGS